MLKRKCDECDEPATHHSVEIIKGKKIEKHLCDTHAVEAGLSIKAVHTPVNELLTNFVKLQTGQGGQAARREVACQQCGMTFSEFREKSLLGCPGCYTAFEDQLGPLLQRAHEGANQHLGKVPRRSCAGHERQLNMMRVRKRLEEAVSAEDYELAARLRDDLTGLEEQSS